MRLRRRLLRENEGGLSSSQMSALGTVVRLGPIRLGDLAAAEQVRPPTVTRIAAELEELGLVLRHRGDDRRSSYLEASPEGSRLVLGNRRRRTAYLARRLRELDPADLATLDAAVEIIDRMLAAE